MGNFVWSYYMDKCPAIYFSFQHSIVLSIAYILKRWADGLSIRGQIMFTANTGVSEMEEAYLLLHTGRIFPVSLDHWELHMPPLPPWISPQHWPPCFCQDAISAPVFCTLFWCRRLMLLSRFPIFCRNLCPFSPMQSGLAPLPEESVSPLKKKTGPWIKAPSWLSNPASLNRDTDDQLILLCLFGGGYSALKILCYFSLFK